MRLIDDRAGETVSDESVTLDPQSPGKTLELRAKPTRVGDARYRVSVTPLPGERNTENNADALDVTVLQDRLRVLFVDGYPRFEYRFLKNALIREKTMELSVLLLEADEEFVQEGAEPIRRFPESPEELNRYDVVLFGDVDPRGGWLTPQQMNMLLDYVGNEGGGFGLIAGERFAAGTWARRSNVDSGYDRSGSSVDTTPYRRLSTRAHARRARPFRFTTDRDGSRPVRSLPGLFWVLERSHAQALVLAEHPTCGSVAGPCRSSWSDATARASSSSRRQTTPGGGGGTLAS